VVRPGESLWTIASDTVEVRFGGHASETEVARYWVALMAANQAAVAVTGDADIIYPGMTVVLPPL
jgi:hypothetical protein